MVVLLPDGGRGYLTKVFNDTWMSSYGFLPPDSSGATVADVLTKKSGHAAGPGALAPERDGRRGHRDPGASSTSARCPSSARSRR